MRGILIDPGCAPEIRKLPNTAQGLNAFLGGEVQIYRFGSVFAALVYTHQAHQAMPNRHYIDRWYYGRLCIVGWRNNRMTDLPAELGTLTRRLLTAAADGALLCIGHIKGGFTDEV